MLSRLTPAFLIVSWTLCFLQRGLNGLKHVFNKVLKTFLWDFGPYWDDNITQFCWLHIRAVVCSTEIWYLCGGRLSTKNHCHDQETTLRWSELINMVCCPAGNSHQKVVCCGDKGMDTVSNNTQARVKMMLSRSRKCRMHDGSKL